LIYEFEDFTLDLDRRELRSRGALLSVEPQVFDLLAYLIASRDHVVTKDDLIEHVWNGRIVSESTLTSRISAARHAIGDSARGQRLIRTIARKGIRFVGEAAESPGSPPDAGVPAQEMPLAADDMALPPYPDKPSIAVLPFTNMSGDPEQEYFSDGITEDVITALSRLHWFFVIARNSTFVYKGQGVDVSQVGRDLGVQYVLEGSVRKSGQRVRVTCQLLDGTSGKHIWSDRYDRELTDIFAVQDEITASAASAIEPKLLAAEGLRTSARSTGDLDAWDMVARALSHFWKLNAEDSATATAILRQAVERYPNYAPAHSMLAFALFASSYVGWIPLHTDRELARQLANRAIELDGSDPWAHLALGYFAFTGRRTEEAIRQFETALELNPNFAAAAGSIGFSLALDGRSDEALQHFAKALRMSPHDPFNAFFYAGIAAAHYLAGRYEDAVAWAQKATQLRPTAPNAYRILCASLGQLGRIDDAETALHALKKVQPEISLAWAKQAVPYTAGPMEQFLEGMRKAGLE
jgi:TolB-like protein/tetratricopeptide (TPR) repeat protein